MYRWLQCLTSMKRWLLLSMLFSSVAQGGDTLGVPAVVNPIFHSSLRPTLSLDGEWDFATDPASRGEIDRWFDSAVALPNSQKLKVPGCWEAQGVGGEG